jgi:MSHA biogenesis protein MshN
MSLINQMLRDLDARRAPAADRAQLQNVVLAAPQKRPTRLVPVAVLAIVVLAGGVGAWYWFAGKAQPAPPLPVPPLAQAPTPQPAPAPPLPAPAKPAAAAPAKPPVASSAQPQSPLAPPAVAAAPARAQAAAPVQPAAVPGTAATATPPAAVAQAEPARPKGRSAGRAQTAAPPTAARFDPMAALPVQAQAKAAPAVVGEPSIEKRPHTPLANEAAENEYNKGVAALRRGAPAEAANAFRLALRFDAAHVQARQTLLSLLMREQLWGEAQVLAEEGLAADPTQTGWAIALARLQMEKGKLAEASETLARHARYAERNADYQAFHALLLQKQKRYHEACDRYIAAVTMKPSEARWWYGLGVSLEGDERPVEAREAFTKARDAGNLPPELAGSLKYHLR